MSSKHHGAGNAPANTNDLLDNHPFDAVEHAVLDIARRFFASFAQPEGQAWIGAFESARHSFGHQGALLACSIVNAIQALRSIRTADFGFINPDCPCCRHRVTSEERYFIAMLHAIRRGRKSEATLNAMLLCGGLEPVELIEATILLARDLAAVREIDAMA